jgi:hypothetical protein
LNCIAFSAADGRMGKIGLDAVEIAHGNHFHPVVQPDRVDTVKQSEF